MACQTKIHLTKWTITTIVMVIGLLLMLGHQPLLTPAQASDGRGIQFVTHTPIGAKPVMSATVTALPSLAITPTATSTANTSVYLIVAGDTLLDLAFRYDLPLAAIEAANPGLEPTRLQIGQAIQLPLDEAQFLAVGTPLRTPPPQAESAIVPDYATMESNMRQLVNRQRESRDMDALTLDPELKAVAKGHAIDMAKRNYFDHTTPEGITLRDRLHRAGIDKNWVGENIQVNTLPPGQSAAEAMRWFLNSQPHRDNILAEPYTRLGVGVAEGPPGWYVFVLVFAGET